MAQAGGLELVMGLIAYCGGIVPSSEQAEEQGALPPSASASVPPPSTSGTALLAGSSAKQHGGGAGEAAGGGRALADRGSLLQHMELLTVALGLLINATSSSPANRAQLRSVTALPIWGAPCVNAGTGTSVPAPGPVLAAHPTSVAALVAAKGGGSSPSRSGTRASGRAQRQAGSGAGAGTDAGTGAGTEAGTGAEVGAQQQQPQANPHCTERPAIHTAHTAAPGVRSVQLLCAVLTAVLEPAAPSAPPPACQPAAVEGEGAGSKEGAEGAALKAGGRAEAAGVGENGRSRQSSGAGTAAPPRIFARSRRASQSSQGGEEGLNIGVGLDVPGEETQGNGGMGRPAAVEGGWMEVTAMELQEQADAGEASIVQVCSCCISSPFFTSDDSCFHHF